MSHESPTRRDLLKPLQLLGMAFGAALFAGIVTLVSMGFFQQRTADEASRAVVVALIIAGVSFIAVLLIVSLLLLAVDPAQVTKQIDKPVLLPDESEKPAAGPGVAKPAADEDPDAAASTDPKA